MPVFTLYMKKVYVVVFFVIELPTHTLCKGVLMIQMSLIP